MERMRKALVSQGFFFFLFVWDKCAFERGKRNVRACYEKAEMSFFA